MMLDVSRHFYPVEFVKKQIRAMARFKLNRLHLHLTDAAGWRLEIARYPRLTDFAAWRTHPDWKSWWNGGRQYAERGSADAYGGYYTRNDIRELVEYALVHYITMIPEIEMPSHSEEVLTAYPELSCTHEPYKQADFCPGNEQTFEFLQGVLDEVMELFPSEYIHVGGDEAGKGAWRTCPLCRARMDAEGISDVDGLQNYLFHRIGQYLNAHGRKLIGWDEIIDGEPAAGSAIMSWRGTEGGVRAITRGYRAIMCPGGYCYLDAYQDAPATQPEAIGGYLPLERVYSYEPLSEEIRQCDSTLLYGVQGNLWTEYVASPEHAEQMLYPRMLALAEVGWSLPANKDFDKFHQRALAATDFLRENGYNCFDLRSEVGNRPEALAPVEHRARGCKVTYADDAPYFPGYAAGGDSALVDGIRGGWSYGDSRWQGFTSDGGLDVTIDLGKVTDVSYVGADFMQICGPWVYMPAEVVISASTDGENFTELARIPHTVAKDDGGFSYKLFSWQGTAQARHIRYRARRGEFGGFLFTDEIVVR
jgi:hexosaminidase